MIKSYVSTEVKLYYLSVYIKYRFSLILSRYQFVTKKGNIALLRYFRRGICGHGRTSIPAARRSSRSRVIIRAFSALRLAH